MLHTQGRGRFVGVELHVWNPRGGWWGEGDEKFYIDGEKFPSTFGTGSEDYFGYAWCNPTEFQNCYHNQTRNPNNRGHISVNRWHITDNLPFQTLLRRGHREVLSRMKGRRSTIALPTGTRPNLTSPGRLKAQFAGKAGKYLELYRFFEDAKAYSASHAIDPLRGVYNRLAGDADLAGHRDKATLAMARIEKTAGNTERYNTLLQPLIEKLTDTVHRQGRRR